MVFKDVINFALPNKIIREVTNYMCDHSTDPTLCFSKYDIDNFYGSIKQEALTDILKKRIKSLELVDIIMKAVKNITVPATARKCEYKSYKHSIGVPQGLSISNVLASIYINSFDKAVSDNTARYFRYVDDILIFNSGDNKDCLKTLVVDELSKLELKTSKTKTSCKSEKNEFDYLGYLFRFPTISIRQSSVDKFIRSITAKFTSFHSRVDTIEQDHKWMTKNLYSQIFIEELNLRITGAISSKKRYGWVFYFIEMNDLRLLKEIDNVVAKFIQKSCHFAFDDIGKVKKLTRTYFEARHTPMGGYIQNYDKIETMQQKLNYLVRMGITDQFSDERLSPEQVDYLYEKTKNHYLSLLELDVGGFS